MWVCGKIGRPTKEFSEREIHEQSANEIHEIHEKDKHMKIKHKCWKMLGEFLCALSVGAFASAFASAELLQWWGGSSPEHRPPHHHPASHR